MGTALWLAESLRLTVFTGLPLPPTPVSWWQDLAGEPPEQDTRAPKTGQVQQTGPFSGMVLQLTTQPSRIDWNILAEIQETEGHPNIGTFDGACTIFNDLMLKWFPEAPAAARIAFGAVLTLPVQSREEGYQTLLSLTRLKEDILQAADLVFQINRPRASTTGISDLKINRLSIWTVAKLQKIQLQRAVNRSTASKAEFACRLQLDINTDQEFLGELKPDQMGIVYKELVELASEISIKGDCP